MREHQVGTLQIFLIAATRGMIGFGAGLLAADVIGRGRRKPVGAALLAVGALSTIPLAIQLFRKRRGTDGRGVMRGADVMAD